MARTLIGVGPRCQKAPAEMQGLVMHDLLQCFHVNRQLCGEVHWCFDQLINATLAHYARAAALCHRVLSLACRAAAKPSKGLPNRAARVTGPQASVRSDTLFHSGWSGVTSTVESYHVGLG